MDAHSILLVSHWLFPQNIASSEYVYFSETMLVIHTLSFIIIWPLHQGVVNKL